MISKILEALKHLVVSTKWSPQCRIRFAQSQALPDLISLMRSCNRSEPHKDILQLSLEVIDNLAQVKTSHRVSQTILSSSVEEHDISIWRSRSLFGDVLFHMLDAWISLSMLWCWESIFYSWSHSTLSPWPWWHKYMPTIGQGQLGNNSIHAE